MNDGTSGCKDSVFSDAEKGDLYCQAVRPRENTDVAPEYVVVDDPEDPAFYSTCYLRAVPNVVFRQRDVGGDDKQPVAAIGDDDKERFQFGQRCLSCEQVERNKSPIVPHWDVVDESRDQSCVHCGLEPAHSEPVEHFGSHPWQASECACCGRRFVCCFTAHRTHTVTTETIGCATFTANFLGGVAYAAPTQPDYVSCAGGTKVFCGALWRR